MVFLRRGANMEGTSICTINILSLIQYLFIISNKLKTPDHCQYFQSLRPKFFDRLLTVSLNQSNLLEIKYQRNIFCRRARNLDSVRMSTNQCPISLPSKQCLAQKIKMYYSWNIPENARNLIANVSFSPFFLKCINTS